MYFLGFVLDEKFHRNAFSLFNFSFRAMLFFSANVKIDQRLRKSKARNEKWKKGLRIV